MTLYKILLHLSLKSFKNQMAFSYCFSKIISPIRFNQIQFNFLPLSFLLLCSCSSWAGDTL
uniref:Uncharacterized protein n=1 Tax=Cyanidioschyzon merolae (strain NIES-3377 / 10D) TaxID=280699 RepID=Q85G36_CYAM1|nr:ORF60 [Cyanidioschyzon merolae strain 10D]BAC76155.1 unnamed protein product [Cyanidioschyzon merolae strain 10D]